LFVLLFLEFGVLDILVDAFPDVALNDGRIEDIGHRGVALIYNVFDETIANEEGLGLLSDFLRKLSGLLVAFRNFLQKATVLFFVFFEGLVILAGDHHLENIIRHFRHSLCFIYYIINGVHIRHLRIYNTGFDG
jgi:hypothetical protein